MQNAKQAERKVVEDVEELKKGMVKNIMISVGNLRVAG